MADLNKLTQKSQEALPGRPERGGPLRPPGGRRRAPARRSARRRPNGLVPRLLERHRGRRSQRCAAEVERSIERSPRSPARSRPARSTSRPAAAGPRARRGRGQAAQGRVRLGRAPAARAARRAGRLRVGQAAAPVRRRAATASSPALPAVRGNQRVTSANPEVAYEALEKYGVDLVAQARARQARPGDRPRRRDPPRRSASCRARPRTTRC